MCSQSGWPLAHRASAWSNRRALAPRYHRSGWGRAGKACIGGMPENRRWRTSKRVRNSAASSSTSASHRARGRCPITSLPPRDTTATSKRAVRDRTRWRVVPAVVAPRRATSAHDTRNDCASSVVRRPQSASSCEGAPTPAAAESPSTRRRSSDPAPSVPARGPGASGRRGVTRRT